MNRPLTTVIVSSFDRPRLIVDALDSLRAQTYGSKNLQVIIADDHSDLPTRKVIEAHQHRYASELHCFVVQPPTVPTMEERRFGQRCAVCINAAMEHARGEFVAFLPDDDFLTPQSIEVRVAYLTQHPKATCVYGRLQACISQNGAAVPGVHFLKDGLHIAGPQAACVHNEESFYQPAPILRAANKVDHGMMLVRRTRRLPL